MEVCIFSGNQIEAEMVKNALDENGIVNYMKNYYANLVDGISWLGSISGTYSIFGNIEVIIKEKDVEKSLEIIKTILGDVENEEII